MPQNVKNVLEIDVKLVEFKDKEWHFGVILIRFDTRISTYIN